MRKHRLPPRFRVCDAESRRCAKVNSRNALHVTVIDPITVELDPEVLTQRKELREFFATDGGSKDMNIDGDTTNTLFKIAAQEGTVKWIKAFRIVFHDTNLEMDTNDVRRFGDAAVSPGLTNGIEVFVNQGGVNTNFFIDPIKAMVDFLPYMARGPDGFTNIPNSITTQEDYLHFDFILNTPVVLPVGSPDYLGINIKDDLTALAFMRGIAAGYQEFV
jgi:hypothetical protein